MSFIKFCSRFLVLLTVILCVGSAQAVLDDPRDFVEQQYRDFLGREGEPTGIAYWTEELSSGRTTRAEIVATFFNSAEFQNGIAPIARLYLAYFRRIPDYAGLQYWIGQFQSGVPLETISQSFADSAEFINTYGSLDDAGFVTLVYQNVLERNPDDSGLAYWVAQLQSGLSRGNMMAAFSESPEYRTLSYNRIQVIMIYVGMLRRGPDQGGYNYWVGQLDQGYSVLNLIQGFLDSTEYAARFDGGANRAPVASALSTQTNPAIPLVQLQLIGTDPDGDTLSYVLVSAGSGPGYSEAYVAPQSGRLYATLDGSGNSFNLSYRVSDGLLFSEPATVGVQVTPDINERDTGERGVDPQTYGRYPIVNPYGDLLGTPGGEASLPRAVDLSGSFPLPGNQGRQGSCVAWATAYAMNSYQEKVEINWELDRQDHLFSPAFVYNQIQQNGCDGGSLISDALELFQTTGAATWDKMPYTDTDCSTPPNSAALQQAGTFKIRSWGRLQGVDPIKAELANHRPVVIGVPVYDSMMNLRGPDSVYNTLSGNNNGGHAITIVGYNDDRYGGAFRIINSWGTGWGDNGYFWLTYDLARQGVIAQAYSVQDAENPVDPEPVDPPPPPSALPNLQIMSWDADYDERPGGAGELQFRISNTGTVTAPAGAYVNLMLSDNADIGNGDIFVIYEQIPFDLEPGETAFRDEGNAISFQFPDTLEPGTYYMALWVDDLNTVPESNEEDNVSLAGSTIAIVNSLPDLVIQYWYADWDDFGQGSFIYEVANEGQSPAPAGWDVNLVISPDEVLGDGNDTYLFYEDVSFDLASGEYVYRDESSAAYFDFSGVPEGEYYMAVWVDDLEEIAESNERNNQSWDWGTFYWSDSWWSFDRSQRQALSDTEPAARRRAFNGRALSQDRIDRIELRRVQIVATPEGGRRLRMLDDKPGARSAWTAGEPALKVQDKPLLLKTIKSKDVGVFPTSRELPMR